MRENTLVIWMLCASNKVPYEARDPCICGIPTTINRLWQKVRQAGVNKEQ